MIRIEFENIKLSLITEENLEQIRHWRNAGHVNQYMRFRGSISAADQKIWFENLDKKRHLYFIISIGGDPAGIINLKDINWGKREAEAGIFIGEQQYLSAISPVIAVMVLMKAAFDLWNFHCLYATISRENLNAIRFNQALGYRCIIHSNDGFDLYQCNKQSFVDSELGKKFPFRTKIMFNLTPEDNWIMDYCTTNPEGILIS